MKIIKNIKFFLPLLIIFSSLRIFGYVSAFVFFIPYIFQNKDKIIYAISKSNLNQKFVISYFIFLFLEIIYGAFFIGDFRILIYWFPFLVVLNSTYFKNFYDLNNNKFYFNNYYQIIYKASLIYFIFYFILNLLAYFKYGAFFKVQDFYWIGSSGAFGISSIFFFSLSKLWEKEKFRFISLYNISFLFYIFLVLLNESRFGILYSSLFLIYILIKNIEFRNYLNINFFLVTILTAYSFFSVVITQFHLNYSSYGYVPSQFNRNIISDSRNLFKDEDNRKKELFKGFNKFTNYPTLNKLIGTGWYSSRITIALDPEEIKPGNLKNKKVYYLQAIVAIILDTGLIGFLYLITTYYLSFFYILESKEGFLNKIFFTLLLGMNFFGLFLCYPIVNIAYILFLLPNGIIYLKQEKKNRKTLIKTYLS